MVLIDNYFAEDKLSMENNNSSAFCSRSITGKPGVYSILNRGLEVKGMTKKDDPCYLAFIKRGYEWGGDWDPVEDWFKPIDYHHFQKNPSLFIEAEEVISK